MGLAHREFLKGQRAIAKHGFCLLPAHLFLALAWDGKVMADILFANVLEATLQGLDEAWVLRDDFKERTIDSADHQPGWTVREARQVADGLEFFRFVVSGWRRRKGGIDCLAEFLACRPEFLAG